MKQSRAAFICVVVALFSVGAFIVSKTSQRCAAFVPNQLTRTDLHFGYYGDCPSCIGETRDHTTMQWIAGWSNDGNQVKAIIERTVSADPQSVVLMLPGMYVDGELNPKAMVAFRAILNGLKERKALNRLLAIYPQDEPDLLRLTDAAVRNANSAVRSVLREFDREALPLAVIYTTKGQRPGITTYDWIGVDSYRLGARVLDKPLRKLKKALRKDQRLLLVPGGTSPWKQDPAAFFEQSNADPQVVGIVAFLWFDNASPKEGITVGIRSNGTSDSYRRWGCAVLSRRSTPC